MTSSAKCCLIAGAHQVGFVPYYPLAGGFLTGKYEMGKAPPAGSRGASARAVQEFMIEKNYRVVAQLSAWAKDHGRGVNELAQAWLLAAAERVLGHHRRENGRARNQQRESR